MNKQAIFKGFLDMGYLLSSLAIAVLAAQLLCHGQTHPDLIPYGDGRAFAQRAIELHGLLHSGQWRTFLSTLGAPDTVTLLPNYLLFFAFPTALAGGPLYGVINCFCMTLLLALGVWGLLRELRLPHLAPPVVLLCLANNYALDYSSFFYMDLTFASCCLLVVWLRVRSLLLPSAGRLLAAGCAAGLVFFVKPGAAAPFVALDVCSGLLFYLWKIAWSGKAMRWRSLLSIVRFNLLWAVGFFPAFLSAAYWGAAQRITQQLLENQNASFWGWSIRAKGLVRVFYYPLCMSYFYSFVWMGILAAALVLLYGVARVRERLLGGGFSGDRRAVVGAIVGAYLLLWGFLFSFVMSTPLIRSIPLMLPLFWIAAFSLTGLRRLRAWVLASLAGCYFLLAYGQYFLGVIPKQNRWAEHYALEGDWLNRLPAKRADGRMGVGVTKTIVATLDAMGVHSGKVGVGTAMLYWDASSLNWLTQTGAQLRGQPPRFEFGTMISHFATPWTNYIDGASAFIFAVHPRIEPSRDVLAFNIRGVQYAQRLMHEGKFARDLRAMQLGDGRPGVVVVALREPLSVEASADFIHSAFDVDKQVPHEPGWLAAFMGRRRSILECLRILLHRNGRGSDQDSEAG